MPNNIEEFSRFLGFVVYIFFGIFLCIFILILSHYLGEKSKTKEKHIQYESGINSFGVLNSKIPIKFYLIAIFFVIFDIEAVFLYPWVVSIKENGWFGFIEINFFIGMLLISLFYLFKIKALNWSSKN